MSTDIAARPGRLHGRRRTILLIATALVLIVAITVVAVSCSGNNETGPPTVVVDRGTVALAVSASGSIAPGGRQSLGFADGGTVTEVLVNVGDQVQPGQVLARIDDTVARQTLAQRQATLAQQTATLNKLIGGNSVEAAEASLDKAQDIERATRRQVDATNAANRSATSRAQTQLSFDKSSLDRAEQQYDADRSACRASPRTTTPTATTPPAAAATVPTTAVPTTACRPACPRRPRRAASSRAASRAAPSP